MNYLEKLFDGVHYVFNLNAATLSGAIDIIVVPQEDGTLKCTPFHVRFGKLQLLSSREKIVTVCVNGTPTPFQMKMGNAGEAFFVEETDQPVPHFLAASPVGSRRPSASVEMEKGVLSTEQLVTELQGSNAIIASIAAQAAASQEATPLTAALEAIIANNPEVNVVATTTTNANSITTTATITTKIPETSAKPLEEGAETTQIVGSPNTYLVQYDPQNEGSIPSDEESGDEGEQGEDAKWRLAWGWGGLPKIVRAKQANGVPIDQKGASKEKNSIVNNTTTTAAATTVNNTALDTSMELPAPGNSSGRQSPFLSDSEDNGAPAPSSSWSRVGSSIYRMFKGDKNKSAPPSPVFTPKLSESTERSSLRTSSQSDASEDSESGMFEMDNDDGDDDEFMDAVSEPMSTPQPVRQTTIRVEEPLAGSKGLNKSSGGIRRNKSFQTTILVGDSDVEDCVTIPVTVMQDNNNLLSIEALSLLSQQESLEGTAITPIESQEYTPARSPPKLVMERGATFSEEPNIVIPSPRRRTWSEVVQGPAVEPVNGAPDGDKDSVVPMSANPEKAEKVDQTPTLPKEENPTITAPEIQELSEPSVEVKQTPQKVVRIVEPDNSPSSETNLATPPTGDSVPEGDKDSVIPMDANEEKAEKVEEQEDDVSPIEKLEAIKDMAKELVVGDNDKEIPSSPTLNSKPITPTVTSAPSTPTLTSVPTTPTLTSVPTTPTLTSVPTTTTSSSPVLTPVNSASSVAQPSPTLAAVSVPSAAPMSDLEVGSMSVEISLCGSYLNMDPNSPEAKEATEKLFTKYKVTYEQFCSKPELINNPDLVFRLQDRYYPWSVAGPMLMSLLVFRQPLPSVTQEALLKPYLQEKAKKAGGGWKYWPFSRSTTKLPIVDPAAKPAAQTPSVASPKKAPAVKPVPPPLNVDPAVAPVATNGAAVPPAQPEEKKYTRKTLRPSSEQLKSLNLQPGINRITFSVTSALQGTREVSSSIYYWAKDVKIIVSDIDGTITKSDVYGQIAPMIGRDWTHVGVAQLYTNIAKNGYKIVYLTSRAIGQAGLTKSYITSVKQGEQGDKLPDGPVLMSPNRLLTSFNREVIRRNPEEFKIACLKDIRRLFPTDYDPFYAGFGNRITDAIAYRSVNIPEGKIFTINPHGVISNINRTYQKSYLKLNETIAEMFPPADRSGVHEKYNDWNFWKSPTTKVTEFDF